MNIIIAEEWNHFIPTGKSWYNNLHKIGQLVIHIEPNYINTLTESDIWNSSLLFIFDADKIFSQFPKEIFRKLYNKKIRTIAITNNINLDIIDNNNYIESFVSLANFDKRLEESVYKLKNRLIYVPLAGDDDLFYPLYLTKQIDYSFIGTFGHGDRDISYYLLPAINNNKLIGFVGGEFNKQYIKYENLNQIYNLSKVNLNFHYPMQKDIDKRLDLNGRTFEIALSGNFQLIDDHPLIEDLFDGKLIGADKKNYYNQLLYYLENHKLRNNISEEVRKICMQKHTWKIRMKNLLKELNLAR